MGHLINPTSIRLGVILGWNSDWVCSINLIYLKVWSFDFVLNGVLHNIMSQPKLWRLGVFFSHYKIYRLIDKIFIKIFVYDGRMFEVQNFIFNKIKYKIFRKRKLFRKKKLWKKLINLFKFRRYILNKVLIKTLNFSEIKYLNKKFINVKLNKNIKNIYNDNFWKNIKKKKKYIITKFIRNKIILGGVRVNIFTYFLFLLLIWELKFLLRKFLNNLNVEFAFYFLTNRDLTAKGIVHFIQIKLRQRIRVNLILKWVRQILIKYTRLAGFKFQLSGRFTRKQRKARIIWLYGPLSLNKVTQKIDYAADMVRLKYSACGIKVWLHYYNKRFLKRKKKIFF